VTDDLCMHELDPRTCSICLHGTARKIEDTLVITECGSENCDAEIFWVETQKGKLMPVDAEPTGIGNIVIVGRTLTGAVSVRYLSTREMEDSTENRYTSHFATCVDAARYRRNR
jgi:hypothetical protein